jgi:hypothetical protein
MYCFRSLGIRDRGFGSHWRRGWLVCMRLFRVCVVLCLGRGLATSWSPKSAPYSKVWARGERKEEKIYGFIKATRSNRMQYFVMNYLRIVTTSMSAVLIRNAWRIHIMAFLVMTPCSLVGGGNYIRSGEHTVSILSYCHLPHVEVHCRENLVCQKCSAGVNGSRRVRRNMKEVGASADLKLREVADKHQEILRIIWRLFQYRRWEWLSLVLFRGMFS